MSLQELPDAVKFLLLTDISSPAKLPATSDFFTNIMFFFYSTLKGDFCWYLLDEPSNIFTALKGKFVSIPHPFSSFHIYIT